MGWIKKRESGRGCLFCRIAKGGSGMKNEILYRTKDVMVIMNIFPYNTGHLQVLPVRHAEGLDQLSESEITSLFVMVGKCVKLLEKVLAPAGFNIGLNIGGDVSGASVKHLHVHVVPRFKGDLGFMETTADTKVLPETLEQTYKKLKKEAGMLK